MNVHYTTHAEKRLVERNISKDQIERVLSDPDSVLEMEGHLVFQKGLQHRLAKDYLIRVFVVAQQTGYLVLTAYRTSKIAKYS